VLATWHFLPVLAVYAGFLAGRRSPRAGRAIPGNIGFRQAPVHAVWRLL